MMLAQMMYSGTLVLQEVLNSPCQLRIATRKNLLQGHILIILIIWRENATIGRHLYHNVGLNALIANKLAFWRQPFLDSYPQYRAIGEIEAIHNGTGAEGCCANKSCTPTIL